MIAMQVWQTLAHTVLLLQLERSQAGTEACRHSDGEAHGRFCCLNAIG